MSIELKEATFSYMSVDGSEITALGPTTLSVAAGEFTAVIGANGSGKSTLGKLMNGLLVPTSGEVAVDGRTTTDMIGGNYAARTVGMVFQNPDNQLIATLVEDDTAFGPENLGVPPLEIRRRVDDALKAVGMFEYLECDPNNLSAGQRQKIAVAGVLAMRPRFIVFDEPTSMLDPAGRRDILSLLEPLRRDHGIGIVYITNVIEEAAFADRIIVLKSGRVTADGGPHGILSDETLMREASLYVTGANALARRLAARGLKVSTKLIVLEEVAEALCSLN